MMGRVAGLVILLGALGSAPLLPGEGDDTAAAVEVTGWIVDELCKRANANPSGEACTRKCHADGAKLLLFEEGGTLYALSDQEEAAAHIGYVRVRGRLEGAKIVVLSIEDLEPPPTRGQETESGSQDGRR